MGDDDLPPFHKLFYVTRADVAEASIVTQATVHLRLKPATQYIWKRDQVQINE